MSVLQPFPVPLPAGVRFPVKTFAKRQRAVVMAQRYVLITGCGEGGIGEALAREYQKKACTVITTVLPWESKDHLISAGIQCYELDVTDDASVQALERIVDKVTEGRLHVLVNNA
ncbi:hypothetical protein HO133_010327 [Letharia lupina]|uniref:Uncharacterized protein n=1 Tax=Letharia lupina TaxID=560253 RepID=A0A8H6CL16_9LECA|nr:uncharacterized protein HO133_010327 [Letharia lupina]KAF6225131.1 hypothetical protein HO133_010327 [Letharia lupina]